jgi:AraC-like DNA-binding protein
MLVETPLSVADISGKCGFQHPEYMCAVLKKHTGWSPAQYRAQYGGANTASDSL